MAIKAILLRKKIDDAKKKLQELDVDFTAREAELEQAIAEAETDEEKQKMLKDRLEYELGVINQMGYTAYFLIVWDYINYARENGIMVGPGRGSAAGSIVAYSLGITDIDPIRYQLLFERFLNTERVTMPKQYWAFNVNFIAQRCTA